MELPRHRSHSLFFLFSFSFGVCCFQRYDWPCMSIVAILTLSVLHFPDIFHFHRSVSSISCCAIHYLVSGAYPAQPTTPIVIICPLMSLEPNPPSHIKSRLTPLPYPFCIGCISSAPPSPLHPLFYLPAVHISYVVTRCIFCS